MGLYDIGTYVGSRLSQYEGSSELQFSLTTCEVSGGKTQSNRNALSFPITSWSWLTNWTHRSLERSRSCSSMGRTYKTNSFVYKEFMLTGIDCRLVIT